MESLDYWRLCEELSIFQTAILISGEDPAQNSYAEDWEVHKRPMGYEAAKAALTNGVMSGEIEARNASGHKYSLLTDNGGIIPSGLNINETIMPVSSIKKFLKNRGLNSGFFFPIEENITPDYLSKESPYYASKLAAAIEAWQAVTSQPELIKGKSAKQALIKWLRENAARFDLTKEDGNPNGQGIDEIAKIANWDTKGGAPKTPG